MLETKKTFCRICHAACPMEIDIENGQKIVAVRGDRSDPLFEGYTCIKGRQLADHIAQAACDRHLRERLQVL